MLNSLRSQALGALAVIALAAATMQSGHAETWKTYTYTPNDKIAAGAGLKKIASRIEEETGGALELQIHLGGSLPISVTDMTQAVGDGVVQFGDDVFFLGHVDIGGILRLPMLLTTPEEYETALEIVEPHLARAWDELGVVMLGSYYYPLTAVYSTEEVTKLADLEGKKVRTLSPEQAAFVEAYGGTSISIGSPEVASALQQGVVDAVLTATPGGGRLWGSLVDYKYELGPDFVNGFFIANKSAFNALSAENQEIVRSVVADVAPTISAQMQEEEESIDAEHESEGMVITPARSADVEEAASLMAPVWEEWAESKGETHQEVLARVREALGK